MSCKDRPQPGPMVPTVNDCVCIPSTLYLATHLAAPWIEVKSSKTGQFYYFNRNSNVSVYALPKEAILPYDKTKFFQVPWTRATVDEFDAAQLAQDVLHLDF
nr:unnamed protein product [Spirometra erinaceieuropaei]